LARTRFQADRLVGGSDAVLVIDDTAVPKKARHKPTTHESQKIRFGNPIHADYAKNLPKYY